MDIRVEMSVGPEQRGLGHRTKMGEPKSSDVKFSGWGPQPAQGTPPAMTSSVGMVGAPPDRRWGCVQVEELTLFLPPSQPSWTTRKEENVPSLPTPGAQVAQGVGFRR